MIHNAELNVIRNRAEKATESPWRWSGGKFGDWIVYSPTLRGFHNNGGEIAELDDSNEEDAEFIAHAREDIPKLLVEIERLKKGIDNAIFCLANEDISDEYVVDQIRMELVRLYQGEESEQHPFNKF